ncbi:MAG: class I SAM-dependent RNA methyltransferase [Acidimicrobiia bacterium]|nr:class I SAM-dependent RNA methyltransferase [Acidimicrobiia bacterium]
MSIGRSKYLQAAAVCPPGLEQLCAAELKSLGLRPKPAGPGLVEFEANVRQLYAANVWLRTAGRIVVRLATFRATDFVHLQDHAAKIDWARWIEPGRAPRFRISTSQSKLYHTKAIAQRLHQVSLPPSIGEPEQLFIVRISRNTVTISVDASGEALHHRPWRIDLGDAPLRPTMAAACLQAVGWDGNRPLIDPFCGSGTFAVEAALMALGLPAGGEREFAFHTWPSFDTGAWASVAGSVQAAHEAASSDQAARPEIVASDRDPAMVAATEANAARAEVAHLITAEERVVSHLRGRSGSGLIITNPPYGKRLGSAKLTRLYGRLGAVARERLPEFDLAVLTAHRKLALEADGAAEPVLAFRHGGLGVKLYRRAARPPGSEPSELGQDEVVAAGGDQPEAAVG